MILSLTSDWNIIMTIGAILACGGVFLCVCILVYCILKMESDLKNYTIEIPALHFYKPFIVYREYLRFVKSTSDGPQKRTLNKKIVLVKRMVLLAPFILLMGLLVMVIGKGF